MKEKDIEYILASLYDLNIPEADLRKMFKFFPPNFSRTLVKNSSKKILTNIKKEGFLYILESWEINTKNKDGFQIFQQIALLYQFLDERELKIVEQYLGKESLEPLKNFASLYETISF
ncbi:MAG: hypothetical protein HC836_12715 [Richelia sp. RM2_1_2]|nr:hypothetical protein [Richelia sp. RM2_1_2]